MTLFLFSGYEFDLSHYEGAFAFDDIVAHLAAERHCEDALVASYDWIPGRDVPHAFHLLSEIATLESQVRYKVTSSSQRGGG